ncbi:MAG: hypothetical protein AB4352_19945 [Hormoscilla sp.]
MPMPNTEIEEQPDRFEKETNRLQERFKEFIRSLGEVMNDITALEVNTMIVAQISGNKFIPEEAYQYIYEIPASEMDNRYFVERQIPLALYPRYRNLRKKLAWEYRQLVQDPIADIFDTQERLPNPGDPNEQQKLQRLLDNGRFLRGLRKIIELKSALDSSDLQSETTDIIYAQTIMQLDGDIINRYHEQLLSSEFRQTLVSIHSQGVSSGEQQWHGILAFMVNIVQAIIQRGPGGSDLPFRPIELQPSDFPTRPGDYGR